MNKDEIKKAFDICCDAQTQSCTGCPILELEKRNGRGCKYNMFISVFDLINEQENEIEQLKAEFKQLETNAEILARGVREFNHENYELTKKVKQAQIDTINTIIEYCKNPNHWNELKDCKLFGGKSDDLRDFLNGIFKEGNDENARTL